MANTTTPHWFDRPVISQKTCDSKDSNLDPKDSKPGPLGRVYIALTTSRLWRHSVGRGSSFCKFFIHAAGMPILTLKICYEHLLIPFAKLDDKETINNLKNRLSKETAAATNTKIAGEAPKNKNGQSITKEDFDDFIYHEKHLEKRINEDINALKDLSHKSWYAFKHVIIAPPIAYESLGMAFASTIHHCISGLNTESIPGAKEKKAEKRSEEAQDYNKIIEKTNIRRQGTGTETDYTETEYTDTEVRTENTFSEN